MKNCFKRTLSCLLAVICLIAMLPAGITAEEELLLYEAIPCNPDFTMTNEELFRGYAEKIFYPDESIALFGTAAGNRLNASERAIYDFLSEKLSQVANGTLASTVFVLDAQALTTSGTKITWTREELGVDSITDAEEIIVNEAFWEQLNITRILTALLSDFPYEAYWFDKTVGFARNTVFKESTSRITVAKITFFLAVSPDYQPANYNIQNPSVDTAKTGAATKARKNAQAIVDCYALLTDLEKLVTYKSVICKLVSYNNDAVSADYGGGYGDPWQLIYVFDGDANTNVVCEGYSKAFQYLCDISEFTDDVMCSTVTGVTVLSISGSIVSVGNHMWNIITMENGKNYLADITNSDTGTIGQHGHLFLPGAHAYTGGYAFPIGSYVLSYIYDSHSTELWGTDANSILYLSDTRYSAAEASKEIVVQEPFRDTVIIEKFDEADGSVTLHITPKGGHALPKLALYYAIYNAEGSLKTITKSAGTMAEGQLSFNLVKPVLNTNETFKVMLWTQELAPLLLPVSITKAFWKA